MSPNRSSYLAQQTLGIIMGGGQGTRLFPLTRERSKPATPLAGKYRLVDIPISNCINSGITRMYLLTQFNSASLHRHISQSFKFDHFNGGFVEILAAEQTFSNTSWYQGTADAVRKNLVHFRNNDFAYALILSGDQLYQMDFSDIVRAHVEKSADLTIATLPVPAKEASALGILEMNGENRITRFVEKPKEPAVLESLRLDRGQYGPLGISSQDDLYLASMGIYVFDTRYLVELLKADAADPHSEHDFGKNLVPYVVKHGKAVAHRFSASCVRAALEAEAYWRDVGTIDAYWESNIDLTAVTPALDLYDTDWPIWTYAELTAPAKFVHDEPDRRGNAVASLVSGGCIVSGTELRHSLLFTGVRTHSYAHIDEAVILPHADIGRRARLSRVVIDRGVHIPAGLVVGEDPELDARRFRRTERGICLITQPMIDVL